MDEREERKTGFCDILREFSSPFVFPYSLPLKVGISSRLSTSRITMNMKMMIDGMDFGLRGWRLEFTLLPARATATLVIQHPLLRHRSLFTYASASHTNIPSGLELPPSSFSSSTPLVSSLGSHCLQSGDSLLLLLEHPFHSLARSLTLTHSLTHSLTTTSSRCCFVCSNVLPPRSRHQNRYVNQL